MKVKTYWPALPSLLIACNSCLGYPAAGNQIVPNGCKSIPGTASWPSEGTWAQFNQSIGGKLLKPTPPGAVCHPEEPTYNLTQCAVLDTSWYTYDFHQGDPIYNMWQQYNNDTCLIDPNAPCSGRGYPAYVVNATTAVDVKLGLDFARQYNVRVVVKSTGHDYQGRSQAPGALSIWVHHMQDRQLHNSFQPKGCNFTINTTAVTVGGGSQIGALVEDLDKINQTVVGGTSKSVSVGGYITGGGHSVLAPLYGMAADQVLELEVVTPLGDIVTANECQNEDLFWAMRGGGGSTFGVMTSVTLATHPTPKIVAANIVIASLDLNALFVWEMVGYLLSQFPYLDFQGVSGYSVLSQNYTVPDGNNGTLNIAGLAGTFLLFNTQNQEDMQAIWEPIITYVNTTWPTAVVLMDLVPYPSLASWLEVNSDQDAAGYDGYVGSHLLDATSLTSNTTAVGQAFETFNGEAFLVAGNGTRDAKPRGGSTAVNPSWRKTIVHATNGLAFVPLNITARSEALASVNAMTEPLRQLAPNMGAYVNENNPGEPNWHYSFWGDNYERLVQIKRTVDPNDVLWCHPCVGNERWEYHGYQLCPVDEVTFR
ncbi:FAD-binding domain-containing protein [Hypoxylon argillaceum]|nr:FAD-binding domain-containing protein [Hypoxylon argillaceum]